MGECMTLQAGKGRYVISFTREHSGNGIRFMVCLRSADIDDPMLEVLFPDAESLKVWHRAFSDALYILERTRDNERGDSEELG